LPEGIAHFLEHRLFEKPAGDIGEHFTELGADVDAQTGLTSTSFSFTASAEALEPCLQLLFELAGCGYFPEDSVLRERAIIAREIQLFDDSIEWVAFQAALAALYEDDRIAVDIAGTPESLLRIDAAQLSSCHRHYYHAGALQLFISGPVDAAAVCEYAARLCSRWPQSPRPTTTRQQFAARPTDVCLRRSVPRPRRLLAFPDPGAATGRSLLRRELALELGLEILFGASSRFFSRHYESGLVDGESFGGEVHLEPGYGFCFLGGDTDHPDRLQAAIAGELSRVADASWVKEDFEPAARRAFGEMVCHWEDVEGCCGVLETAALRGCHPFDIVDLYHGDDAVNAAEVADAVAVCLRPDNVATATVLPSS
jgi:predicted Zn-dependent peptidase